MKRKLNWKPSPVDDRDRKYRVARPGEMKLSIEDFPKQVDLRKYCSPIMDQLDIGSCTGNALAGCVEFLELLEMRQGLSLSEAPQEYDKDFKKVSRLFIYFGERQTEGTITEDAGATTMRDGCDFLLNVGVCIEDSWPYSEDNVFNSPPQSAYQEASGHKIAEYLALEGEEDLKRCLAHGYPFVCGIQVYDSFMSDAVAKSGMVQMPNFQTEKCQGGHAIMCVGYDDISGRFLMRNSWGVGWGQLGYFWIPKQYLLNPALNLAGDFYTLRRVKGEAA